MGRRLVTFQTNDELYKQFCALTELENSKKGQKISELIANYVYTNREDAKTLASTNEKRIMPPELFAPQIIWIKYVKELPPRQLFPIVHRLEGLNHMSHNLIHKHEWSIDFQKYIIDNPSDTSFFTLFRK